MRSTQVFGSAWRNIFQIHYANRSGNAKAFPQYPRRTEDEEFWENVYFLMYGAFGTLAQFCGILISKRAISRVALVLYSRIYALFHAVIGIHHLLWSFSHSHGKLQLWRFQLPGVYATTGFSAIILIYHALYMARGTVRTANLKEVCWRKNVMDTATCTTFLSVIIFLLANMTETETSVRTDRIWWGITMYSVPVVLLLGSLSKAP